MLKVVIAGSASLQKKMLFWKNYWEKQGAKVLDWPRPIKNSEFFTKYPNVHIEFLKSIMQTDILFIANEDKNGISGYIGAETFAELDFGIAQNLIYGKQIRIILLKMPSKKVQSYDEIKLWLKLGWIELFKKSED